ncbi:acetyl-CoA C-acyltransferase [Pontibacter sp. G13]|uniref:acetyl-CoA C-acyltransferase n=1 Tax=Pontibacter sp. G13 TaxID=3074898 RepID=UPI00288C5BF2|nr:acetyl-CoA C-acyltransferase [Pontibacter sp. G13]WNJ16222.1 acetyl-CoA C-acyltransferase [Pontibacter sp. G13]
MEAYIVAGLRTAVGKANRGGFKNYRPDDLGAEVIKSLVNKVPELDPTRVDDLICGCAVPEAEQGMQVARMVSLMSLPMNVSGVTVNRYCGSGLETIAMGVAKIKAGMADVIIAGGIESMSMVPVMGHKPALNYKIASQHPDWYLGMGLTAEEVAVDYNISREDMDEFSYNSHQKALKAIDEGRFKDQIVPIEVEDVFVDANGRQKTNKYVVDTDEGPRRDTNLAALGKLRPVFRQNGTVTAGNSSQTSDGASFVMIMSEKMVKELNLTPIARMVGYATEGVDPRIMGMGPIKAVPKVLKQTGLSLNDIQQIELNEAFAAQSLAVIRELDLNPEIINVNGGAIALGHPLGCSGSKLSVQLMNEMKLRNQRYGMVTACVGGGQGVAGIYEVLSN